MARMKFGGGPQDIYLFADTDGDMHAGGGFNALFFDGPGSGANSISDLLTSDGQAVTYITTADGTLGTAAGQIPVFWGPDGVYELWVSINSGPRQLMSCNNAGSYFADVKAQVDNLLNSGNPNPTNLSLTSLVGVDKASLDAAPAGSTLIKRSDGTYGAGGAPVPLADTIYVAAVDAPASFASAQYLCDGIADNVQIQQAVDNALGMRVGLSPGTFNLAAPINLNGPDDATKRTSRYVFGAGMSATNVVVGSGVTGAFRTLKGVSAHIWDMNIAITGASTAIDGAYSSTAAAAYTSWVDGSVARVKVTGPGDGTLTNYAINLTSAQSITVEDVVIQGCTYGIRVHAEQGAHVTGYSLIRRCTMNLAGNSANAFRFSAAAGAVRAVTITDSVAVIDPIYTGSVAVLITPTGEAGLIRMSNISARGFSTAVTTNANAYEVYLDFSTVEPRNTGTFATMAGFGCKVTVAELALGTAVTTATLVTDTNSLTAMPNEYEWHLASTGSAATVTGTLGSGVVRRGIAEGSITVPAGLLRNPLNLIDKTDITPVTTTSGVVTTPTGFTAATQIARVSLGGKLVSIRLVVTCSAAIAASGGNIADTLIATVNANWRPTEEVGTIFTANSGTGEAQLAANGQVLLRTADTSLAAGANAQMTFTFLRD